MGKNKGGMEPESEEEKLIKTDHHIVWLLINLLKKSQSMEQDGRTPDGTYRPTFQRKLDQFLADREVPFIAAKAGGRKTIQNSGIRDLEEEWHYLQNRLSREQVDCPGSWDLCQKKGNDRKLSSSASCRPSPF